MKKIYLLIFALIGTITCFGQYTIAPAFFDVPMIIQSDNGTGTAFGYRDSQYCYIVTAKHMLIDPTTNNFIGNNIIITFYTSTIEDTSASRLYIDGYSLNKKGLIKYPADNSDVIAIAIGRVNKDVIQYLKGIYKAGSQGSMTANYKDRFMQFDRIVLGDDAIILGYPKSLGLFPGAYDFNKPLLRKGIIAGIDKDKKRIIIDCPVYGGNSGGPVFTYDHSADAIKLIGIVSGLIPYYHTEKNSSGKMIVTEHENSGYSVIETIDKIVEITEVLKMDLDKLR